MNKNKNFLIAAGGTGGHIFPAIVLAKSLRKKIIMSNGSAVVVSLKKKFTALQIFSL